MTAGERLAKSVKKKNKQIPGESGRIVNIKHSTHADMKTVLLNDTENPVRGYYQSIPPCCAVWQ